MTPVLNWLVQWFGNYWALFPLVVIVIILSTQYAPIPPQGNPLTTDEQEELDALLAIHEWRRLEGEEVWRLAELEYRKYGA